MSAAVNNRKAILMMAYTHYESDPRVIREAEAAVSGGFDVDFLALRLNHNPAVENVRGVRVLRVAQSRYRGGGHVSYLASYLQFFLRCFGLSTMLHLRRRYVAIHVNNMPDFLVFSTLIPRLLGAKVILDIHDPMPNTFVAKFKSGESGFFYRLLLWQERLSAAYCHRVITVHHPVRDGILVQHGLSPESIEVIANFADEELFRLREHYQVGDVIRLVFHGTILERSGLRPLMQALAKVRHRDRIRCRIIGEGDFSQTLRGLIESLGLGSMVEFDNRSYPVHEIPARINDCHVGIIPLELSTVTNYALPLKLVEYIAMGLPVISIRSAAITYYFKEQDCLFYQWDDPASLATVIDALAENPRLLQQYRDRSVAIRHRFLWSHEKQKYIELLRGLAGEAPLAAPVAEAA
jgi:glycosyltransferase involved in cell wall biosynthesis